MTYTSHLKKAVLSLFSQEPIVFFFWLFCRYNDIDGIFWDKKYKKSVGDFIVQTIKKLQLLISNVWNESQLSFYHTLISQFIKQKGN